MSDSSKSALPVLGEHRNASSEIPPVDVDYAGNVALVTLGCAKNLVDSEIMLGSLLERGFRPVSDAENADLIVVNTCAFLESAVQESIDRILELARYKEEGRCRRLVVAGCMVERYRDELKAQFPEVDRFVSTDELLTIANESSTTSECFDAARRPYFLYDEQMPRVRSTGGASAFVKIAEGCDRPCSFCIIPKLRGGFRSRSIESVVNEVCGLHESGVREFNLVAQDLTAYGTDFKDNRGIKSELPSLISSLGGLYQESDPFWVRLFYAYPVGTSEELIAAIRELPFVCNYLDLPIQHISHPVLKAMKRPLGEKNTRALIEQIRCVAPDVALRTTLLVGFPGEREEDVLLLEQFIKEGHFAHVGVFAYSDESEAESASLSDVVAVEEREARRARIMEAQQAVVKERLIGFVGKRVRVLIEGEHPETPLLVSARTEWQGPETDGEVLINELADELLSETGELVPDEYQGRFGEVQITEAQGYDLVGQLLRVE